MDHDARIEAAIRDLESQERPNIAAAARKHNIARTTLSHRFKGETVSNREATSFSRQKLDDIQEEALIAYVNKLNDRGFPPTPQVLKTIAESIAGSTLGPNWVARFCKRHRTRLAGVYLRAIDHKRKTADGSQHFQHFSDLLAQKLDQYDIRAENIYNVDERGFLIRLSRTEKRVASLEGLKSKRAPDASQDGNREFITLIASICANGSAVPPSLISQGESDDLQGTWLDEFDHFAQLAFFACSENGWSDNTLRLDWLGQVFDRAVFPPHSTYQLQPLDIGLFPPFTTYYSQAIDRLLSENQGLVKLTKRDFWPLFYEAWEKAIHAQDMRKAWEEAGLYPLYPKRVISTTVRQQTPPDTQQTPSQQYETPDSTRSFRRMFRQFQAEGKLHPDAAFLLRASEMAAVQCEILQQQKTVLLKAVLHEEEKRKCGKATHFYDEGKNETQARFSSPAKRVRVRARTAAVEDAQRQNQLTTRDGKLQVAIPRAEKVREAEEQKQPRQLARQAVREQLGREKAERRAAREAKRVGKVVEAIPSKHEVDEQRAQSIQAKEAKQATVRSNKRSLEEDKLDQPQKRVRTNASRKRNTGHSRPSSIGVDTKTARQATRAISYNVEAFHDVQEGLQSECPISQSGRSRRPVRLPTRFR